MLVGLGRNYPYIGSLEAGLQSSNKEPMYGLVCPPHVEGISTLEECGETNKPKYFWMSFRGVESLNTWT